MPALPDAKLELFAVAAVTLGSFDAAYRHVFLQIDRVAAYELSCDPFVAVRVRELREREAAYSEDHRLITLRSASGEYEDIRDSAKLAGEFGDAIKAQDRVVDLAKLNPVEKKETEITHRFVFQTPPGISNLEEWKQLTGMRPVIEKPAIEHVLAGDAGRVK